MSRRSDDLIRLSEAEADRLARLYMEAEREILLQIDRAMARGNDLRYLRSMLDNVQAILEDLLTGNRQWCEQAIPRVYVAAAEYADQLTGMTGKVSAGFGAIHQQAVKVLADNTFGRLESVRQVIGRRSEDLYRQYALEATRQSVIGYKTWKQVSTDFRDRLRAEGITGFTDAAGRNWNMKTYAEMVARTTTAQAHWEGTSNRLLEHGIDLVVISSHAGACEKCEPWQGKIVSLTGKTPGYPTMQQAIDAGFRHPNCRHSFSGYVDLDAEIEALEKELGETVSVREDRQGPSAAGAGESVSTSLSGIPDSLGMAQAAKQGIEQAAARILANGSKTGTEWLEVANANSGQSLYNQVKGTADEVVFPQALVKALTEAARQSVLLVHNHIDSTAFSDGDIARLVQFDSLKGIFVVGHDGTQYYIGKTAETPSVRESTIRADYQKYLLRHLGWLNKQIAEGKMTKSAAYKEYSHRVAESLARAHKLEYIRWGES